MGHALLVRGAGGNPTREAALSIHSNLQGSGRPCACRRGQRLMSPHDARPAAVVATVRLALLDRDTGDDPTGEAALSNQKRLGPTLRL